MGSIPTTSTNFAKRVVRWIALFVNIDDMKILRLIVVAIAAVGLILTFLATHDSNEKPTGLIATAPEHARARIEAETDVLKLTEVIDADVPVPAFVTKCRKPSRPAANEATAPSAEAALKNRKELYKKITNRLTDSDFSEHLHLAALIEKDPQKLADLIDRAVAIDGGNPMLIWDSLHYCSQTNVSADCPLRELEERILSVDGQNSEALIRVAANRYANGNLDEALRLLRRASTSAVTNDFWTQRILLIERGLAASTEFSFAERAEMAIGIAAAQPAFFGDIIKMCKDQSAYSSEWAYACAAYGNLAETQGKTMMTIMIAQAIQKLAYEELGEVEKAAKIETRMRSLSQAYTSVGSMLDDETSKAVFGSPTLFSAYLATVSAEGEIVATQKIHDDVQRILNQQPELACDASQ